MILKNETVYFEAESIGKRNDWINSIKKMIDRNRGDDNFDTESNENFDTNDNINNNKIRLDHVLYAIDKNYNIKKLTDENVENTYKCS